MINGVEMNCFSKHYILGPAELLYSGKSCGLKDLTLIFDSGASYAYFTSRVYQEIVSLVRAAFVNGYYTAFSF